MSGPAASALAAATADNTSMALIIAAVLVGAAAAWLAIELRRAWSPEVQQELREEERVPQRRSDREITMLLEDVAEELVELRATVEQLRTAPQTAPVAGAPEPETQPEPVRQPKPALTRPRPVVDEASWPTEVDIERYNQLKLGRMRREAPRYPDNGEG